MGRDNGQMGFGFRIKEQAWNPIRNKRKRIENNEEESGLILNTCKSIVINKNINNNNKNNINGNNNNNNE